MTAASPMGFQTSRRSVRPADELVELDRIELTAPVKAEGGTLPAGATGTIVTVWKPGEAFEVEFTTPFQALLTLKRPQVERVARAGS